MKRIVLDETPVQPSVVFGQTLLRGVIGAVLLGHGAAKWLDHEAFTQMLFAQLGQLGLADADPILNLEDTGHVAYALSVVEMVAGSGLILGWLTHLCAVILMSSSVLAAVFESLRVGASTYAGYELPLVLLTAGAMLFLSGGGPASVDNALKQRARRRAILEDSIWGAPPYVSVSRRHEDDTARTRGRRMAPRY